jgi:hypothetical protein
MQLFEKVEGTKVNNFPFYLNSKIEKDFELKIQETNQISNLLEF